MMWYGDGTWSWGSWLAMSGLMMLFVAAAIGIAVWTISSLTSPGRHGSPESPRGALDRRLANGDIGEEEYARARWLIEGRGARPKTGT